MSCSNSQGCKGLLEPLYSNKNHPNPFVELSSTYRDASIGKDAPLHLRALGLFTYFWRKTHTQSSAAKEPFCLAVSRQHKTGKA